MSEQQSISFINNPKKGSKKYQSCLSMVIRQYATYIGSAQGYDFKHFVTRRVESIAGLMMLFGIIVLAVYLPLLGDKIKLIIKPLIWWDFANFVAVALLWMRMVSLPELKKLTKSKTWTELQNSKEENKELVNSANSDITTIIFIWAAVLLLYILFVKHDNYEQLAIHSLFWGVMLFAGAYSANRKYGYTRAFMRNGFYAVKVEVLYYQLIGDHECINTIWGQLAEISIEAKAQAYKDTVNDYIEVNNSISKWLSSKKLK